jgi:hypothetical protein
MSARTPAGRAKRNTGTVEATCTSETITGLESSVVIGHAAAAAYIPLPMFATTVAVQMTENAVWRNGVQGEGWTVTSTREFILTLSYQAVSGSYKR